MHGKTIGHPPGWPIPRYSFFVPLSALRQTPDPKYPLLNTEPVPCEQDAPDNERVFLCRKCQNHITSAHHAIKIKGKQQHTFFNPMGILFEIKIFSSAKGAMVFGKPSEEFSWFVGFSWQVASCTACHTHLGWYFQSATGSEEFFGLILNRLMEGQHPSSKSI